MSDKTANILAISRDRAFRNLLGTIAAKNHHTAKSTGNYSEGTGILESEDFDIVFVDLKGPRVGGVEFFLHVKEIKPDAIIIIQADYTEVEHAVKAVETGADAFLYKPFDVSQINLMVRQALEMKEERSIRNFFFELANSLAGEEDLETAEDVSSMERLSAVRDYIRDIKSERDTLSADMDRSTKLVALGTREKENLQETIGLLDEKLKTHNDLKDRFSFLESEVARFREEKEKAEELAKDSVREKKSIASEFEKTKTELSGREDRIESLEKRLEELTEFEENLVKAEERANESALKLEESRREIDELVEGLAERDGKIEDLAEFEKTLSAERRRSSDLEKKLHTKTDESEALRENMADLQNKLRRLLPLEGRLNEAEELNAELKRKNEALEERLENAEAFQAELASSEDHAATLSREKTALEKALAKVRDRLGATAAERDKLQASLDETTSWLAGAKNRVVETEESLETARGECTALGTEVAALKGLREEMEVVEASGADAQKQIDKLTSRNANLSEQLKSFKTEKRKLEREGTRIKKNLDASREDLVAARTRIETLEASLDEHKRIREKLEKEVSDYHITRARLDDIKKSLATTREQSRGLKEEMDSLVHVSTSTRAEKAALEERVRNLMPRLEEALASKENLEKDMAELFEEKIRLEKELAKLSTAREKIEDLEEKLRIIREEKSTMRGKLDYTSDDLKRTKDAFEEAGSELDKTRRDLDDLKDEKSAFEKTLRELRGEKTALESGLRDANARMESLLKADARAEEMEKELAALSGEKTALVDRLNSALPERDLVRQENTNLQERVRTLSSQIEALKVSKRTDEKAIASLTSTVDAQRKRVGDLEESLAKAEEGIEAVLGEKDLLDDRIDSLERTREKLEKDSAGLREETSRITGDLETVTEARNWLEKDLDGQLRQKAELASHIEELGAEVNANVEEIGSLNEKLDGLRNENADLLAKLNSALPEKEVVREENERLQEKLRKHEDRITALVDTRKTLEKERRELRETKGRLEGELDKARKTLEKSRLLKNTLSRSREDRAKMSGRIEELSAQIENVKGNLKTRMAELDFVKEQKISLESEVKKLRNLVGKAARLEDDLSTATGERETLRMENADLSVRLERSEERGRRLDDTACDLAREKALLLERLDELASVVENKDDLHGRLVAEMEVTRSLGSEIEKVRASMKAETRAKRKAETELELLRETMESAEKAFQQANENNNIEATALQETISMLEDKMKDYEKEHRNLQRRLSVAMALGDTSNPAEVTTSEELEILLNMPIDKKLQKRLEEALQKIRKVEDQFRRAAEKNFEFEETIRKQRFHIEKKGTVEEERDRVKSDYQNMLSLKATVERELERAVAERDRIAAQKKETDELNSFLKERLDDLKRQRNLLSTALMDAKKTISNYNRFLKESDELEPLKRS